jgi:hypothetical protein
VKTGDVLLILVGIKDAPSSIGNGDNGDDGGD